MYYRFYHERLQKLTHLIKIRHAPFYNPIKNTISLSDFINTYEKIENFHYTLTGRIISIRNMGRSCFLLIQDSFLQIQLYAQKDVLKAKYELLKLLDLGDIITISGTYFLTKSKEKTLKVIDWKISTKSLCPIPEKWHGLVDIEQRYRQRYLDLIANKDGRYIFQIRSKTISCIRSFFDKLGYLEVETPILNDTAGGAIAKPFTTFHNTLNEHLALRIATEINLKKIIVSGFNKIYEIGKIFRNEGLSSSHNPEFTSIEFYQTNTSYLELMDLTENLLKYVLSLTHNNNTIKYLTNLIDFSKPFKRASICQLIGSHMNLSEQSTNDLESCSDVSVAINLAKQCEIDRITLNEVISQYPHIYDRIEARNLFSHILYTIFEHKIEKSLIQPTFLLKFPLKVSPLSKKNNEDFSLADRFEFYCAGMEIANAFSELNNPIEQKNRFTSQEKNNLSIQECNTIDKDFLTSLEIGMPPTAGEGIGIDRLVMILTNSPSIKDVIFFPKMKNLNTPNSS
ncbi:MAG: lysine--tRNA ligase [Deltaproteobacteria bacterium]|nr:MAG: lysine--tRNA ligase [Deltaproteobacteria bacterium]